MSWTPGIRGRTTLQCIISGEPKRAIELLNKALDLNPRNPGLPILINLGRAHFMLGDYDAALDWLLRVREANLGSEPVGRLPLVYLAMTYAEKGDPANAQKIVRELLAISADFRASRFERPFPSAAPAYKERFETRYLPAVRKAGLPE